jgi:hypothetical protein
MAQLHFGVGDSVESGTVGVATGITLNFAKASLGNMVIGDLLVAWIHSQSTTVGTITGPTGWTAYGAASGSPTFAISRTSRFYYYPIKSQSDIDSLAATLTWTFSINGNRLGGVISRATGIDLDNIEDSASTTFQSGNGSSSLVMTGITTVKATTLLVAGLHTQNSANTTSPTVTSLLTAFDEYKTSPTGSANANTGAAIGYKDITTAGATGNVTATLDSVATISGGTLAAFQAGAWTPAVPTRPTIIGTPTTYVFTTTATSFTIAKPSGVQDGDLLILVLSAQSQTTTSDFACSGWSRISQAFISSSSATRTIAYYALPIPSASAVSQSTFTFSSTDSAAGGRIAVEMFIVRGADLTNITTGKSPYATTTLQTVAVQPATPLVPKNLLLVAYNAQFTSGIDYTVNTGPSGMSEQLFLTTSTVAQSKTILAVYQQDVEADAIPPETLTWNGAESQTSGVAITIRGLGQVDPNPGIALHYTSAIDTLSTAHLYYTSAIDVPSTPAEVRPFPAGYASVSTMLATRPFYLAHRGGSADWPEMSLYAYTQAGFWGVGALELSLARTSDGVWFGLHDDTLDRTSGTSGFTASAHTWAEVQAYQITAAETSDINQPTRPYMQWGELMDVYYETHVIYVDPKAASSYASELLDMMDAMPGTPTDRFIAKYYGVSSGWVDQAHARGYTTWGYFYEVDAPNFAAYQGKWDILGMDYTADQATWTAILSYGKLVIGHVIPTGTAAATALGFGAAGLMVSGVTEVIPRAP